MQCHTIKIAQKLSIPGEGASNVSGVVEDGNFYRYNCYWFGHFRKDID